MATGLHVQVELEPGEITDQVSAAAAAAAVAGAKVPSLGTYMTKLITAPLTMIGAPAVAAAAAYKQASNTIRKATGASGADLEAMMASVQDVRRATGASMDQASGALVELSRGLGLTGSDLTSATTAAARFAQATRGETGPTTAAIVKTMKAWGLTGGDLSSTMGSLAAASRKGGGSVGELAGQLAGAAPALRAAGLTLTGSAALLGDLAVHGVPAEVALAALSKAATKLAKEGAPNITEALRGAVDAIRGTTDAGQRASLAVETFGKAGVQVADAIAAGALDFGKLDLAGKIPPPEPADTLGRAFGRLQAAVEAMLTPLGRPILAVLEQLMVPLLAIAGVVASAVSAFGSLPAWMQTAAVVIAGIVAFVGPALIALALVAPFVSGLIAAAASLLASKALIAAGLTAALGAVAVCSSATAAVPIAQTTAAVASVAPVLVAAGATLFQGTDTSVKASAMAGDHVTASMVAPVALAASAPARLPPRTGAPTLPALTPRPAFVSAIRVASVALPTPMPDVELPAFNSASWTAAFDWARSTADRMSTAAAMIPSPPAPMLLNITAAQAAKMSADDAAALLAQMAKIKPVGKDLATTLKTWTAGDSQRLLGSQMSGYFAGLQASGILPLGAQTAFMPGSWFASNTPEAWAARAVETDRLMGLNLQRDQYWMDAAVKRDAGAIDAWQKNNAAQISQANSRAGIVMAADVFAGINQGWQAAVGGWQPPSMSVSGAPPPPAAPSGPKYFSFYGDQQAASTGVGIRTGPATSGLGSRAPTAAPAQATPPAAAPAPIATPTPIAPKIPKAPSAPKPWAPTSPGKSESEVSPDGQWIWLALRDEGPPNRWAWFGPGPSRVWTITPTKPPAPVQEMNGGLPWDPANPNWDPDPTLERKDRVALEVTRWRNADKSVLVGGLPWDSKNPYWKPHHDLVAARQAQYDAAHPETVKPSAAHPAPVAEMIGGVPWDPSNPNWDPNPVNPARPDRVQSEVTRWARTDNSVLVAGKPWNKDNPYWAPHHDLVAQRQASYDRQHPPPVVDVETPPPPPAPEMVIGGVSSYGRRSDGTFGPIGGA